MQLRIEAWRGQLFGRYVEVQRRDAGKQANALRVLSDRELMHSLSERAQHPALPKVSNYGVGTDLPRAYVKADKRFGRQHAPIAVKDGLVMHLEAGDKAGVRVNVDLLKGGVNVEALIQRAVEQGHCRVLPRLVRITLACLGKVVSLSMFTVWMYFGDFCIADLAWIPVIAMIVTVIRRNGMG